MTRDEFLDYLARAVADEFLSEDEAVELLRKFDAGEIDEKTSPLPLNETITPTTEDDVNRAAIILVTLGILSRAGDSIRFPRITERQQEQAATRLQDRFADKVRGYATTLIESRNLPTWQTSMSQTVQEHIIQQNLMGRLRPLTNEEIRDLDSVIRTQQAFLSRFVDEQSVRVLQDNPMSEAYIGARSEYYNKEARTMFFRTKEEDAEDGTVYDYESVDTPSTCQPCLDAEAAGPYLPGEGPMPSEICEGGGFCRCRRVARYSPTEAAELRNELRAA